MTEPTMCERVARAICRDDILATTRVLGTPSTSEWVSEQVNARWRHYEDVARDVISAMRDPTDAMLSKGHVYGMCEDPHDTWQTMIDAALPEPHS